MSLTRRAPRILVLVLTVVAIAPVALAQHSDVSVRVKSGRTFVGQIDAQTDARELWLRFDAEGAAIYRPIRWHRVVSATVDGQQLSAEQLQSHVAQRWSRRTVALLPPESSVATWGANGTTSNSRHAEPEQPALGAVAPIRSLTAEAFAANWNNTVDADGVVVEISPRDAQGRPTEVEGVLEATLIGEQTVNTSIVPHSAGLIVRELGRWSTNVRPEDFGGGTAAFRFPFQAIHPQFDLDIGRFSLVHVRLTVPGQGVFERTVENVRIRPYSIVRDEIQRQTGQRFLPNERTSRGKHSPIDQP